MPDIILDHVSVIYKNKKKEEPTYALNDIDISFISNTFNVVCGYSGCGKTTLLKAIAGLIDYEGDIFINDLDARTISVGARNIAYVSQNYVLYPHMTVFDNIAEPLKNAGCKRDEIIKRVYEVAEFYNIKHCLLRKPKHLSGGQQQRVALARAMVKKPDFYLFDEPLSNLDYKARTEAKLMILKTVKSFGSTAIYVTHDFKEAMSVADKIYIIDNGKLVLSGNPMDVYNSNNEIVNNLKEDLRSQEEIIKKGNYVVTQCEMRYEIVTELAKICKENNLKLILNPAPARPLDDEVLDGLYAITPNETELGLIIDRKIETMEEYIEGAKVLLEKGVQNVIVTLGTIGSLLVNKNGHVLVPAYKVKAIDTVGAGDSYTGSLAAMLDQGYELEEAMKIATAVAALEVQSNGAIPAMPYKDKVFEFIESNK